MGIFKKYSAAIATDALRLNSPGNLGGWDWYTDYTSYKRKVPTWYGLDGNAYTNLFGCPINYNVSNHSWTNNNFNNWYIRNLLGLSYLMYSNGSATVVATSDELDSFDVYDHDISNSIGTCVYSKNTINSDTGSDFIWSIRIDNNNSVDTYVQNTDLIWHDDIEYYIEDSENPGQYIDVTSDLEEDHSSFTENYLDYYIFVPAGPIIVKCIKFTKEMVVTTTSSGTPNATAVNALYCGYYLNEDEWITIPFGESRNIVIDFSATIM